MKKNNNRGAALVQILIVMLVLSILGTFFLSLSNTEFWQGEREHRKVQAYYYARSGIEAVLSLFISGSQPSMPFFLYGSLDGLSSSPGSNAEGIDEDIVALVTRSGNEITVSSTGTFKGVKSTLKYIFTFTEGSQGSPVIPSTGPGGEGVSGGPPLPDGSGGIGWYDYYGILTRGNPVPSDKPVIFQSPDPGRPFIYKNDNSANYYAPAMYFLDSPDSLVVEYNKELRLYTNFIYFAGDVNGMPQNHPDQRGMLTLRVYDSQIDGSSIGGISGFKYGVIYIGRRLKNADGDDVTYLSDDEDRGFYYFQSGMNLLWDDIDTSIAQKKLIKIDNINDVDFSRLGYVINITGGIGKGHYH